MLIVATSANIAGITDSSWFYSSLAQSAAAVVGLLGGLLLSRLIQQLETVRQSKRALVELWKARAPGLTSIARFASDYGQFMDRHLSAYDDAQRKGQTYFVNETRSFRGSSSGSASYAIDPSTVAQMRHDQKIVGSFVSMLNDAARIGTLAALPGKIAELRDFASRNPGEAGGLALEWADQLEPITVLARRHMQSILPRSFFAIWVVLAWISGVGIVAPLAFLIVGGLIGAQVLLLVGFAVGILALLGYHAYTFLELRRAGNLNLDLLDRN